MEIGISSASFYPEVNTEDTIELMKGLGFNIGEIFLNSQCEYTEDFIKKLVERKDKNDFKVNSVHSFCASFEPFLFDSYKRRHDDMIKYFIEVCNAAKALGASCYTFHGMRYRDFESLNKQKIIDTYNELCYISSERGIKLAQENVSWCMSSDFEFLNMLIEGLRYPLYFTLDVKQSYKAGHTPEEYINIMGKRIVNFHVNDRDEKNFCLLPGKGKINYKNLVYALKSKEYSGNAIIEVYRENYSNYNELSKSREFLKYCI